MDQRRNSHQQSHSSNRNNSSSSRPKNENRLVPVPDTSSKGFVPTLSNQTFSQQKAAERLELLEKAKPAIAAYIDPNSELFLKIGKKAYKDHQDSLIVCRKCGRKFFPDRIQRHEEICFSQSTTPPSRSWK